MKDNLQKAFRSQKVWFLFFSTMSFLLSMGQDSIYSRPPVTSHFRQYKAQVKADPDKRMLELKSNIPGILYDLRYASTKNFMHRLMYPAGTSVTFLRKPAALALAEVQQTLMRQGMGLKIFDAYRPYSVTVQFWELVKDARFVAHPRNGSGHNRGAAVDLTIVQLSTGEELEMGTGFDNFSDTAHHGFTALPETVLRNRLLLRSLMEKNGFRAYEDEWWHYSWPAAAKTELLDIPFSKLAKGL